MTNKGSSKQEIQRKQSTVKNAQIDRESSCFQQEMNAEKKSSGAASTPKGDREAGLNPPIPFVPKKSDNNHNPPTVEITILKDPDKPATKDNTEKKEFPAIKTFTGSGATMVIVLKRLQMEVFEHLGIANKQTKVADRLDYLLQVCTGRASL